MTVVIADTSPLNYLILIEAIDFLPRLYKKIIIPDEMLGELIDDGAPGQVREWAMKLPQWAEVRSAPPANGPACPFWTRERGVRSCWPKRKLKSSCRSTKPPEDLKHP